MKSSGRRRNRPKVLWTQSELTPSVETYLRALGEFRPATLSSSFPYKKKRSWCLDFDEIWEIDPNQGFHRFEGKGHGGWGLCDDWILNAMTADLLAAADRLGGRRESKGSRGAAGGFGADMVSVWVELLDGGIGFEFQEWQDEHTNRPEAWQRTTIRGPLAFRALLEMLGFEWVDEKLGNESDIPSQRDIKEMVNDLIVKNNI